MKTATQNTNNAFPKHSFKSQLDLLKEKPLVPTDFVITSYDIAQVWSQNHDRIIQEIKDVAEYLPKGMFTKIEPDEYNDIQEECYLLDFDAVSELGKEYTSFAGDAQHEYALLSKFFTVASSPSKANARLYKAAINCTHEQLYNIKCHLQKLEKCYSLIESKNVNKEGK